MGIEKPKNWPTQNQDKREKLYDAYAKEKISDRTALARDVLASDVFNRVAGANRKYDQGVEYVEADNKDTVSKAILYMFNQEAKELAPTTPQELMFYCMDYLVNGKDNKGNPLNIDLVEPGERIWIQKDENGRWKLKVYTNTSNSPKESTDWNQKETVKWEGFMFPPAPTEDYATPNGVGPKEDPIPEPNYVEREEFGNAPNNNYVMQDGIGPVVNEPPETIRAAENVKEEDVAKQIAPEWEYKDKTETVFKQELKETLKKDYEVYPKAVKELYSIESLAAKLDTISTQQLIDIREQGNTHLTMEKGHWKISTVQGIDPQKMWPEALKQNELPSDVTTHPNYTILDTLFKKEIPSLWPAFARKLTKDKLDSIGKLGNGNLGNLKYTLYPNQINFYNENLVKPMANSGLPYKEIEASLKRDGFDLIGKTDYELIMKSPQYHSKYSTYIYNNGKDPIETGVWSEEHKKVYYDKAPNLSTPHKEIGAIPVVRVTL